jgi:hypothetical protein
VTSFWLNPLLQLPPAARGRRWARLASQRTVPMTTPYRPLLSDQELIERIEEANWHRSKGYVRADGAPIGAHEYILLKEEPDVFPILQARVRYGPGGYDGVYQGYRHHYLHLGGWKYWATFTTVLNREKLGPEDGHGPDH